MRPRVLLNRGVTMPWRLCCCGLPPQGLVEVVLMALPVAWSLRLLARVEVEAGQAANRLVHAREVVSGGGAEGGRIKLVEWTLEARGWWRTGQGLVLS